MQIQRFLLDTSALLALRDDEPGVERVAQVLGLTAQGKARSFGCFVTLMEVLYRVWRDESESSGRLAYLQCLALPIEWRHESEPLLLRAAEIKARHQLSLADAWIAASAVESGAILLHKDPEFTALRVAQEVLPFKTSPRL